jgi:hypothetical protein
MKVALICLLFIGGLVAAAYGVPNFKNEDQLRDYLENIWEIPVPNYPPNAIFTTGPIHNVPRGSATSHYGSCPPGYVRRPDGKCINGRHYQGQLG